MPKHTERVLIEEVDWPAVMPWLKLFRCFRMAMHPSKLILAMALLTSLFITGKVMDLVTNDRVSPGEIDQYRKLRYGLQTPAQFQAWKDSRGRIAMDTLAAELGAIPDFKPDIGRIVSGDSPFDDAQQAIHTHYIEQYRSLASERNRLGGGGDWQGRLQAIRDARRAALRKVDELRTYGTFHTALQFKLDGLNRLARATVTFNFGWSELAQRQGRHPSQASSPAPAPRAGAAPPTAPAEGELPVTIPRGADVTVYQDRATVIAAVRDLVVILPGWLWAEHRGFVVTFTLIALLFYSILGGAIARLCALDATRSEPASMRQALRFSSARAWSFFIAPLAPIGVVFAVGLLMMVGGYLLFSPSGTGVDILGGLLFIIAILCAAIITMTIILAAAGLPMVYPAVAVEGADVFDAIARAFNYVINRPWRWFAYNAFALIYGALTYLFLSFVMVLLVSMVHEFVGLWVTTQTEMGVNRFDVILPPPQGSGLSYTSDYQMLDWSGRIAAILVRCWMFFTIALTMAYAITFFFSSQTWVYLLLRKSADGVGFEDVYLEEQIGEPGELDHSTERTVPDKMEPDGDPAGQNAAPEDAEDEGSGKGTSS